ALGVVLVEDFLTQQWMGFPVSQVSGRRSNQFCDFMAVLELGAVDLNYRTGIAGQTFGCGFNQPGFSRSGRAQKKKITDRPAGARHPREVCLIDLDYLLNSVILTDDELAKVQIEFPGLWTA